MTDIHAEPSPSPNVTAPAERLVPPTDRDAVRDRFSRMLSVLITVILSYAVPTVFGVAVGYNFGSNGMWFFGLIGFGVGGYFLMKISKRLFVYNEENHAYVTNNPLTGENVPYGPKASFSHPWEQRNQEDEYDLQVISVKFSLPAQTGTSNLIVDGMFQYRINLANITTYIAVNPGTVQDGLLAFIKTFLSQTLAGYDLEGARKNIGKINAALKEKFIYEEAASDIQLKNGINTVNILLTALELPPQVQATRNSVDEAQQLMRVVASLAGMSEEDYKKARASGAITHQQNKEFIDRAMAMSNNNATVNINTFEGDGSGKVTPMVNVGNKK